MLIHCRYDELIPIEDLKPYKLNRNKLSSEQIERLAKILLYQGLHTPIIVSKLSGCIVKGHGILEVIKKNSWLKAPVIYQEFDSKEQEYTFYQSNNSIANLAFLDISSINQDLTELGPDFDLEHLGLRDFTLDFADKLEEINKGDENSEWVDMPEFKEGDGYIRLMLQFGSEDARLKYATENNLSISRKMKSVWIVNL